MSGNRRKGRNRIRDEYIFEKLWSSSSNIRWRELIQIGGNERTYESMHDMNWGVETWYGFQGTEIVVITSPNDN